MSEIRGLAADTTLSPTKRAWLALGAFMGGDELLAAALERSILAKNGQRQGPWVRVSSGDAGNDRHDDRARSRSSPPASAIRLAADMDAYVDAYPPKDTLVDLPADPRRPPLGGANAGCQLRRMTATVDGVTRRIQVAPIGRPG